MPEIRKVVVTDMSDKKNITRPTETKCWVAYSADKRYMYSGEVKPNQQVTTGLDKFEVVPSMDDIKLRYTELGKKYVEIGKN